MEAIKIMEGQTAIEEIKLNQMRYPDIVPYSETIDESQK